MKYILFGLTLLPRSIWRACIRDTFGHQCGKWNTEGTLALSKTQLLALNNKTPVDLFHP